jgi:MoxR-like ATPase
MNKNFEEYHLYRGVGKAREGELTSVPPFERPRSLDDPAGYLADDGLRDAVNVSLNLGQPLLVTGEPGTGKTQLASSVAFELNLPPPLVFNAKTTSTAKDLFYQYDAMRHFRDSHFLKYTRVDDYITYEALGVAIVLAQDPAQGDQFLPSKHRGRGPTRSVVLIDEIDKAPRDLPNDILNEIEEMSFTVKEAQREFTAESKYRPILVLTSNSEKNLPDAFLRRCVYYHIQFPVGDRLLQILERRLRPSSPSATQIIGNSVSEFLRIRRALDLKKQPATAELLSWARVLSDLEIDVTNVKPEQLKSLITSYSVLAKTKEDLELLQHQAKISFTR